MPSMLALLPLYRLPRLRLYVSLGAIAMALSIAALIVLATYVPKLNVQTEVRPSAMEQCATDSVVQKDFSLGRTYFVNRGKCSPPSARRVSPLAGSKSVSCRVRVNAGWLNRRGLLRVMFAAVLAMWTVAAGALYCALVWLQMPLVAMDDEK